MAAMATEVGAEIQGVSGNPTMKEEVKGCLGAVCGLVEAVEELEKGQQKVVVRVGEEESAVVVTVSKLAVAVGKVVVVCPIGAMVGDTQVVAKTQFGVDTTGRLLDEATLGWAPQPGVKSNSAVVLNGSQFYAGDIAPTERPERVREVEIDAMGNVVRATNDEIDLDALSIKVLEDEEPPELSEPSKKDIKAAKKRALEKRKEDPDAGATTDDELEMAGFMPQE